MYACPKCKSQLKIYKEYVFEKQQLINPQTGKLSRKVIKTEAEKVDMPGGLQCVECDFIYFGLDARSGDGEKYDYLNKLFEIINESDDNTID